MSLLWQIVKKVNLFCLSTFIQADAMKVEFPEMMSEVIASQLPKVLAGMVRPLLFHTKWRWQHRHHNSAEISRDWITDASITGCFIVFASAVSHLYFAELHLIGFNPLWGETECLKICFLVQNYLEYYEFRGLNRAPLFNSGVSVPP